jgi:hypothetical protein
MNATLLIALSLLGAEEADLPSRARDILVKHCAECHGPSGSEKDWGDFVSDLGELTRRKRLVPGEPDASRIISRMTDQVEANRMPPPDARNPVVPKADIEVVRRWIAAGAQLADDISIAAEPDRERHDFTYVIDHVHRYLKQLDAEDRGFQRFFILINLHNQPNKTVKQADLRSARAGLSKALNSLSWQSQMVVPAAIDVDQTIFAIDIRDLQWERNTAVGRRDLWQHIATRYPYGLKHDSFPDQRASRDQWLEIEKWTGTSIPWMRVDWFATNATQPPLYHELLYDLVIPEIAKRELVEVELADKRKVKERKFNATDIEKVLGVDVARNLRMRRVVRSGDSDSDVSTGPRVLERHQAAYGGYWKSYDFRAGTDVGVIQQHPLGPPGAFPGLERFEFKHDGGEIIFNLPNGLQGYLLVNGQGDRIAYGPDDLVGDKARTQGSFQIVNGISCMSCHVDGMKFEHTQDLIRTGLTALPVNARDVVRRLYVDPADFKAKLIEDQDRFQSAMERCVSLFLLDGESGEPVRGLSFRHAAVSIGLVEAAAELGENPDRLKATIENSLELQRLGLLTLAGGGTIKRNSWENRGEDADKDGIGDGNSLFQRTATALRRIGTPANVLP